MDPAHDYFEDALRLTPAQFRIKYGGVFLLKPPSAREETWDQDIDFKTGVVGEPTETDAATDLSRDPEFAASWRVSAIRKRPGNPFPDRVSVGRARNCDVVLRLAYVSKLHAHVLLRPDGALALVDLGSANGTFVNGVRLGKGQSQAIAPGDALGFGSLTLELIDSDGLIRRLPALMRP